MQYEEQSRAGQRVTWIGAVSNAVLIVVKAVLGVLGRSNALIADAVHSLSDFITDAVVLVGLRFGRAEADEMHPFGHRRIETLASAAVGVALVAVGVFLGWRSGLAIYEHVETHPTPLALIGAALSIVVKEALYQWTVRVGREIRSPAVLANAWHHRSDALSSIAVFAGVVGTLLHPDWHFLDAVAAGIVAVLIVKVGVDITRTAVAEMVDTAPSGEVVGAMREVIRGIDGVCDAHDLKVRLSGGLYQVQVHVVVDGGIRVREGHAIADAARDTLRQRFPDVVQVIVHVDPDDDAGADG